MYDDKDLLQANVTLIAGVLIFLTFTPFSQGVREILERRNILYIIWATMTFFMISVVTLSFFPSPNPEEQHWTQSQLLYIPRILFIAGVIGIVSAVAGIAGSLSNILRGILRDSKRPQLEDTISCSLFSQFFYFSSIFCSLLSCSAKYQVIWLIIDYQDSSFNILASQYSQLLQTHK